MREVDLSKIDLNLLVVLRALLQTRGVTQAARRLGTSQPAVSRALSRLREQFDDRLLIKGNPLMTPTNFAESLAVPLAAVLTDVEVFLGLGTAFNPATSQRVFRLATTDYGAIAVLPKLLPQLTKRAPKVGLEIVPFGRDVFRMLGDGDLDVALYSDDPIPDNLRASDLFVEDYACVVRANHPLTRRTSGKSIKLEDYIALPHILVSVTGGRLGVVDEALRQLGHSRRIALWLPFFMTAALLVSSSDLILTVPRRVVEAAGTKLKLATLALPLELERFGYRMIWHERTHRDPGCAWLRDQIEFASALNVERSE